MTHFAASAVLALGFAACAAAEPWQAGGAADRAAAQGAEGVNPYAQLDDRQWTKVVEGWERLDGADRRWFLTEARKRNARAQHQRAGERGFPIVHRERGRFGNVATPRKAELGAEPRSARRRAKPVADDPNRYGLGFEQRQRKQPAATKEPSVGVREGPAPRKQGTAPAKQASTSLSKALSDAP